MNKDIILFDLDGTLTESTMTVKDKIIAPVGVSRECSGSFFDVTLAIGRTLASQQFRFSQAEKLHDLPGQIFVGGSFSVSIVIEKSQHRWVFNDAVQEVTKISCGMFPEELVLPEHVP